MEIASHYENDAVDDDLSTSSFDPDYVESDTDTEPGLDIEETRAELSSLSIHKKSNSGVPGEMDCYEDDDCLRNVAALIQAGEVKKLKVDHYKAYLRKNKLRLSGNKETLIRRIKEHLEIVNGGGEMKYPVSSFVLNCKGDACTGDIVLFEQNVYEMFNLASRSASGPPCGKRLVAGRIIKESYGSAKQQHTFTIEVLWSQGEKPLPPLYPLLIKGRNLYRMKTLRQRWEDEGERQKNLMEKHSRGSLARSIREVRIQEKEMRKSLKAKKVSKDSNKGRCLKNKSTVEPTIQPQQPTSHFELRKPATETQQRSFYAASERFVSQYQQPGFVVNNGPPTIQSYRSGISVDARIQAIQIQVAGENAATRGYQRQPLTSYNNYPYSLYGQAPYVHKQLHTDELPVHRQPLSSINYSLPVRPQNVAQFSGRKKLCRYYAQGKCNFGDNCKFLHEVIDSSEQSRRYY